METKKQDTSESANVSPLRESYRGIPVNDKSKMWDYSLEEGEDGQRILSFLVDDSVVNFRLNQPKDKDSSISALRLPDADRADFGARGNATKGRFQVHKSSTGSIYGTIHGGKKTMTFGLDNPDPSKHDWTVTAKNAPITDIANLVKSVSIKDKTAFAVPTMDQITAPLTADYPTAMGLSALLGAGGMAAYHVGHKVMKKLRGEDTQDDRPLWQDMLLGAGGGAIASGAFKALGESGSGPDAPRFNHHLLPFQPLNFTSYTPPPASVVPTHGVRNSWQPKVAADNHHHERITWEECGHTSTCRCSAPKVDIKKPGLCQSCVWSKEKELEQELNRKNLFTNKDKSNADNDIPKKASIRKTASIDINHIQNLLSYDQSLTPADRRILISQLEQASRMSQGGDIDMDKIRNSGLGMLFGYITAKLMGFGVAGQIGGAALGGFVGASSTSSGGKQWDQRGFYHY